jgi:hypothetical protein
MVSTDPAIWTAAFFILCAYSFLYKDNIFYRLAEHSMLGISLGYLFVIAVKNGINIGWIPLTQGKIIYIIPIILGFLLYVGQIPGYRYTTRWGTSIIVGVGTALAMRASLETQVIKIAIGSMKVIPDPDPFNMVNNILYIGMTVGVLIYFYFGEYKGMLGSVWQFARYTLMLTLGTAFGGTVLGRVGLFIGRIQFILYKWLGLG